MTLLHSQKPFANAVEPSSDASGEAEADGEEEGTVTTANNQESESTGIITCPQLTCEDDLPGYPELEEGYCFIHDAVSPVKYMVGALCYDITIAKTSEDPMYCPFNGLESYMWMNETLQ